MYNNKLVAVIKANGKVLRERGENVFIPFGTEYTISIKNLNTVRALVSVSIDGTEATENVQLIVNPMQTLDLERFVKNTNLSVGQRFKFIERTSKIEQHRGIGAEDGLIQITYEFEQVIKPYYPNKQFYDTFNSCDRSQRDMIGQWSDDTSVFRAKSYSLNAKHEPIASYTAQSMSAPAPGITVGGSISKQKFDLVSTFATDNIKHTIVLRLVGEVGGKVVEKPITVKHRPECPTCGTRNKATSKFCHECGTGLLIP